MLSAVLHALRVTASMTWQATWSLILGFTLSAVIEALVRKSTIARLLPDDCPCRLATAAGLGAASPPVPTLLWRWQPLVFSPRGCVAGDSEWSSDAACTGETWHKSFLELVIAPNEGGRTSDVRYVSTRGGSIDGEQRASVTTRSYLRGGAAVFEAGRAFRIGQVSSVTPRSGGRYDDKWVSFEIGRFE